MNNEDTTPFEDVLDELMQQESEPSHDALLRWCVRYPEHREALARYFANWAVQDELPQRVSVDEAAIAHRMVSHALNLLHRQGSAGADGSEPAAVRLGEAIVSCGLIEEDFAHRSGLDESIVLKLDRRLIRLATIPRACLERMGAVLGRAAREIEGMLRGAPIPLRAYKSREPPATKAEDFLEAVYASELSEDAKRRWAEVVAAERPHEGA